MGGAHLANRPVRVVALCNLSPPPDLYAEAFLVSHHVQRDPGDELPEICESVLPCL